MKTLSAKANEVEKKWYVVDARDQVVGRLATRVAIILRGKHKPIYTPHVDTGDFVIIINADKARFTGNKLDKKEYYHHTGYPGGIKMKTAREIMEKNPDRILMSAIRGMIPKNRLGRRQLSKLKVYSGSEHPHTAQSPEPISLNNSKES